MFIDNLKAFVDQSNVRDFKKVDYCKGEVWAHNHHFGTIEYAARPKLAFVDWLRCTTTNIHNFYTFAKFAITKFKSMGFEVWDTGRGMSNYNHCFAISYAGERAGSFCADTLDSTGGLFELTGLGCQMLQCNWTEWCDLMSSLSLSGFGLTRLDVSTDLRGTAWHNYNCNIAVLHKKAYEGKFKIGNGGHTASMNPMGDWSPFIVNEIKPENYNPYMQCAAGLSFSLGKRDCANSILFYEKGKQLLGSGMFESITEVDSSWVRVERRFGRGSGRSKVVIPFDFAIHCDEAIVYRCDGLAEFLAEYETWCKPSQDEYQFPDTGLDLVRVGLTQSKKLLKKAYWASMHAGRLISTLLTIGLDSETICSLLKNEEAIKGFIDNLTNQNDMALAIKDFKHA